MDLICVSLILSGWYYATHSKADEFNRSRTDATSTAWILTIIAILLALFTNT